MKQRMTRNNKKRRGFKVNCLLERLSMKNQEIQLGSNSCPTYMTLTFLGFFDKKGIYIFVMVYKLKLIYILTY